MTKNLHDIRLQNLAKLIENFELGPGNRAAFCRAYGFDPLQMGQYFTESDHGRKMGERKARSIETKIGLNAGWLDKDHSNTNDVSSRPIHTNEAPTKSVPKISLIYADDEEIEMLTAYREATELGKNLFRAAMKNAPRDIERLKTLRKVPAT
ncbi:MAG: hypothetical protein WA071_13845 [Undibacterium umbellatum]|uniref:hypothetical protein n=1 Tax=Undibacterium umbellatum TaxID=2762300 RepID=UPI003BB5E7BB